MKKVGLVYFLICAISLLACRGPATAIPSPTPPPSATHTPTEPPSPTATNTRTETPIPPTETPTQTPSPTQTASPTAKPTLPPYPGQIAFTLFGNGQIEIALINMTDLTVQRLTDDDEVSIYPIWSPDGNSIAYVTYAPETSRLGVGLIDLLNNGEVSLVNESFSPDHFTLSWSADGRYLVYDGSPPSGSERDIYRLDLQTGQVRNLTEQYPTWDAFPVLSPDGSLIAFASDRALEGKATDNIWVMTTDGTGLVNLTPNDEYFWEDSHPTWSPDGTQIAFLRQGFFGTAADPGGPAGLWVVNVDRSGESLVYALDSFGASELIWSPDGKHLAYRNALGADDKEEIWVIHLETGEAQRLAALPGSNRYLSWSPDSQALVFTNELESEIRLYVVAVDGSGIWPIFSSGGNGFGLWSPNLP